MNFKYRTLAIDPGTEKVGITDLELINTKIYILDSIQLKLEGKTKEQRLFSLFNQLDIHMEKHHEQIDDISTEATFVVPYNNKKKISISSPLSLSMARGIIYAIGGKYKKTITEYDNTTHKKSLTGEGDAKKTQIIRAVKQRLNKEVEEDQAMSVSIGFCHLLEIYAKKTL